MIDSTNTGPHILVVNDDPAVLELFEDLLGEEGYRVTLDRFGRQTSEIMETLRTIEPDLVIMDFIVGGEASGWQLLQAAQMDRATRDIPTIVCTAAVRQITELSDHLDAMDVHVVVKPFDIDHLLEVIRLVSKSRNSPTPGLDTTVRRQTADEAPA
jgi:two-component system, OmpR family, response regulator